MFFVRTIFTATLSFWVLQSQSAYAQRVDISPEIQLENRTFFNSPQFGEQFESFQNAVILTGDARLTSKDRKTRLKFEPYIRLDSQDDERSYFDIREATLSHRSGDWDLLIGAAQIFWGVAESRNVVDIINQFDTVEDFDQGEKLGQPLIRLSNRSSIGTFEAYYLPYFREQKTIGSDGRLRPNIDINDSVSFERENNEWAGDFALRYSNRFGNFDVGAHGFYGTSRDPLLITEDQGQTFTQFYQERTQAGVDVQYTSGPWLLKFEAVQVSQGSDDFLSTVGGFEYSFFDIGGKGFDLGIIGEYLYDNRDTQLSPVNLFQNDLFIGTRLAMNDTQDTEMLAGAIIDTETNAIVTSVEFQRRVGTHLLLELEGRFFESGKDEFLSSFNKDNHLTMRLTRYF